MHLPDQLRLRQKRWDEEAPSVRNDYEGASWFPVDFSFIPVFIFSFNPRDGIISKQKDQLMPLGMWMK